MGLCEIDMTLTQLIKLTINGKFQLAQLIKCLIFFIKDMNKKESHRLKFSYKEKEV